MVDILTKTANEAIMSVKQEELMEEEFEDGELVEEGEICDDEDDAVPDQKPGLLHAPSSAAAATSGSSPPNGHHNHHHSAADSSPRDKKSSRDELMAPKNTAAEPLWKPQQDEGFGFSDRDFRDRIGSNEDRDFRFNESNGAEDFDFRDRRRRHSPSPPSHLKRARPSPPHGPFADDGGPPFMGRGGHFGGRGGFRGRGRGGGFGAPRWMERHICKFFREGYCRDGDNCSYSHNAEDSKRRPEVCKFYASSHCKKGLACHHLHGEFPCKGFHKGECTREPCQFSHQPLNDYTRPLFDAMIREEQYNQRMALPAVPLMRRRVLLPGGPVPGAPPGAVAPNPAALAAAQAAAAVVTQGLVAPPGVMPGPLPPGYVPAGAGPAELPPPTVVVPKLSNHHAASPAAIPLPTQPVAPALVAPSPAVSAAVTSIAPAVSTASSSAASAAAAGGGFNISMMLAQIAGTLPGGAAASAVGSPQPPAAPAPADDELESPESPPQAAYNDFMLPMDNIPLPYQQTADRDYRAQYRLIPVDADAPYSGVSSAIISNTSQQSDPRIARLLACQFDAVSSMIAAQQAAAAAAPQHAAPPAAAPPRDPRAAARMDPRRDPRTVRGDTDARVSWMPQMS